MAAFWPAVVQLRKPESPERQDGGGDGASEQARRNIDGAANGDAMDTNGEAADGGVLALRLHGTRATTAGASVAARQEGSDAGAQGACTG